MIADDVATYLAQELNYKKGKDLFVNHYDDVKTESVVIYDTGSVNVENYVNLDELTVQVMVLSKTHSVAKKKSLDIYEALNRKQGLDMGAKCIEYIKATQTPYSLGYDTDRHVWKIVTNYVLMTSLV